MKNKQVISALIVAATFSSTAGAMISNPTPIQAKETTKKIQKTEYGYTDNFKFPKAWQGKWYSNNNQIIRNMEIAEKGFNTPWTGEYVELVTPTKVKGTNKYLWQMDHKWLDKHYNVLRHVGRVSTRQIQGKKWIIFSPIDEKSLKMGFAFTLETRELDGVKQQVLLQGDPKTGAIYDQFFRSPELAQKYHDYHFSDLNYIITVVNSDKTKAAN